MSSAFNNLRILLVDNEPHRARLVRDALTSQDYNVICQRNNTQGLVAAVAKEEPDLVIINMDAPNQETIDTLAAMSEHVPRPIVFFASHTSDSETIQSAVRAGVSAYVVDGLNEHRIKPIIDVAMARFESFQTLRQELMATRTALDDRKVVEKAKGLLMKHQGCEEAEAFRILRKLAMDRSQRLGKVAEDVVGIFARKPGLAPNQEARQD